MIKIFQQLWIRVYEIRNKHTDVHPSMGQTNEKTHTHTNTHTRPQVFISSHGAAGEHMQVLISFHSPPLAVSVVLSPSLENLCSQLKLSSGNSISALMLSQRHTHTHTHTHRKRTRETHTLTHTHTHTHISLMLWHVLCLSSFLTHTRQQAEVFKERKISKVGSKSKTYHTWEAVSSAHSVLVSEGVSQRRNELVKERSSCVCQSEVPLTATVELSLLHSASLSFSRLSLTNTHPLWLSPSVCVSLSPPEIIVYFDSQTLPLSRDPTLQIYSTFFTSHRMPEGRENRVQKA